MRAITLFRALAWTGTIIVWGSLILARWGEDPNLPPEPPNQWEELVVGAGLLATLAALAISVSGRKRVPPSWGARAVSGVGAALVVFIAFYLYRDAQATNFAHLLRGQGWTWLLAGGGMVLGAAVGTFGLKPPPAPHKQRKRH
ncbi:MAG TPA: hypothetical protein VNM90_21880 [Haliangium sp.]|nr:hypothetical protein [Haliangium sp.]